MAVIKIRRSVNVRNIWIHNVKCFECHNEFTVHMLGAQTRKNCPFCNESTFYFQIHPMPGYIEILAEQEGSTFQWESYEVDEQDVEIEEEKD